MMKIILDKIREVLTENRVDDVKRKFPTLDEKIIDYLVSNDPSGNQKYLEWMVKAMTHKPTLQTIGGIIGDNEYVDGGYWGGTAAFISVLINRFHELLPYLVHEEDGKMVGTTDLYQYKFSDSEMINYLIFDLDRAEERKKKKELSKKLKSEADKIYEDKNWLVVRAKTWEASCHYGAGTKWCTTSKDTDSHFKRETERQFLIYVINKNETSENPLYKVAWQIPYHKDIKEYMKHGLEGEWEIDWTKIKLWNAEDTNIARSLGGEYLTSVPKKVKAEILKYMQNIMDEKYSNMPYVDDPYIQSLVEHLGLSEEDVEGIEERSWRQYGMKIYETTEGDYAVATYDEAKLALREWAESYVDDVGVSEGIGGNLINYVTINDVSTIASEDADYYIDDLNDENLLEYAKGSSNSIDNMITEYETNTEILSGLDDELADLMIRFQQEEISEEEYEQELEELEKEKDDMEEYQPKLLDKIRYAYRDLIYDDKVKQMTDDPIGWLKDYGWVDRYGNLTKKAIKSGVVDVNVNEIIDDMVDGLDFDILSDDGRWSEITLDNETYYIFQV